MEPANPIGAMQEPLPQPPLPVQSTSKFASENKKAATSPPRKTGVATNPQTGERIYIIDGIRVTRSDYHAYRKGVWDQAKVDREAAIQQMKEKEIHKSIDKLLEKRRALISATGEQNDSLESRRKRVKGEIAWFCCAFLVVYIMLATFALLTVRAASKKPLLAYPDEVSDVIDDIRTFSQSTYKTLSKFVPVDGFARLLGRDDSSAETQPAATGGHHIHTREYLGRSRKPIQYEDPEPPQPPLPVPRTELLVCPRGYTGHGNHALLACRPVASSQR